MHVLEWPQREVRSWNILLFSEEIVSWILNLVKYHV